MSLPPAFPIHLIKQAVNSRGVSDKELDALFLAINGSSLDDVASILSIKPPAARKRLGEVYKKFKISGSGPGKLAKLQSIILSEGGMLNESGSTSWGKATHRKRDSIGVEDGKDSFFLKKTSRSLASRFSIETCPRKGLPPRQALLNALGNCVSNRSVSILLGEEGRGKTTLASHLIEDALAHDSFSRIVWRSLSNISSVEEFIGDLIWHLNGQKDIYIPHSPRGRSQLLLNVVRDVECLVVIDDWDVALSGLSGTYLPEFQELQDLLRLLSSSKYKGRFVVISSDPFCDGKSSEWQSMVMNVPPASPQELKVALAHQLSLDSVEFLHGFYRGNYRAILSVGNRIRTLLNGEPGEFLELGCLLVGEIREILEHTFSRLCLEEIQVLKSLSYCGAASLSSLEKLHPESMSGAMLVEVLYSLSLRSLVKSDGGGRFCLDSLLIAQSVKELLLQEPGEPVEVSSDGDI